jgi:hypothetical protein
MSNGGLPLNLQRLAEQLAAKHRIPPTDVNHPRLKDDPMQPQKDADPNYVPYCFGTGCGRTRRTRYGFQCPTCGNKMNYDLTHYDGNKNVQYAGEPARPEDALAGLSLADRLPAPYHLGTHYHRPRPAPTPEQLARQAADKERADWNAKVDAKKLAKKGRK